MASTERFDVRTSGGIAVVTNVGMTKAAAVALEQALRGYRIWIRERSRTSMASDLILVVKIHGEIIVRSADEKEPRYLRQIQLMIEELKAA